MFSVLRTNGPPITEREMAMLLEFKKSLTQERLALNRYPVNYWLWRFFCQMSERSLAQT